MAEPDIRWIQPLQNFSKALAQLDEAVTLMRERALSNLERQGVIQAFEYSYELSWNTLKDYLALEDIPNDPTDEQYRQGNTLGDEHRHWFRAKSYQQYRLFFRYHEPSRTIIYAWVNDERTKRAYDSKTDAYRAFRKMLANGNQPDSWDQLMKQAVEPGARL